MGLFSQRDQKRKELVSQVILDHKIDQPWGETLEPLVPTVKLF